jgi:hypothetical protein
MTKNDLEVGQQVKNADGTWGVVRELYKTIAIVRVDGLDETWTIDSIIKVGNYER